jgi:hypothetical protein
MIKVNLIGKKRRTAKKGNWLFILTALLFGGFVIYFLSVTVYVVFSLYSLNSQITSTDREAETISREILGNDALLKRYVLSKFILGRIETINRDKFHYKDYLDQIAGLLPEGLTLRNVDFSNKGWVAVSVSAPNAPSLALFENIINDSDLLSRSVFSSVYTESVAKDRTGAYSIKLQFELRKNG